MKRHELTDEQWELLSPLRRRRAASTGRPARDPRQMLDGILWILGTGAPWRDLPDRFGSCKTVHRYFSQWRRRGRFKAIIEVLQIKLDDRGLIDWNSPCAATGRRFGDEAPALVASVGAWTGATFAPLAPRGTLIKKFRLPPRRTGGPRVGPRCPERGSLPSDGRLKCELRMASFGIFLLREAPI